MSQHSVPRNRSPGPVPPLCYACSFCWGLSLKILSVSKTKLRLALGLRDKDREEGEDISYSFKSDYYLLSTSLSGLTSGFIVFSFKVYHFDHFLIVYSSVLTIFTLLWNRFPEPFHLVKSKLMSIKQLPSSSPQTPSPEAHHYTVSTKLITLDTSYKWIHISLQLL